MGGPGSGNWYRWNKRTTLDDRIAVDVRDWKRRGLLEAGRGFSWVWSVDGEPKNRIDVRVRTDLVILDYRQRASGEEWRTIEEPVHLTSTPCHLGGKRIWFVCPKCDQRAAKLYSSIPYFLCRRCIKLPYGSQEESDYDRALRRAQKVRHKLGASASMDDPIWEKPKGMHWQTFEGLKVEADDRGELADVFFMQRAMRHLGRFQ